MSSPLLLRLWSLYSPQTALSDDSQTVSFAVLLERANAVANTLHSHGIQSGDRVVLLGPSSVHWVETFLGIVIAGAVAVPLAPSYPPVELLWFANNAGAKAVIFAQSETDRAALMTHGRISLRLEHITENVAPAPLPHVPPEFDAHSTALLLYTSGTTGKPKGAMITHSNVAIQAELLQKVWAFSPSDTLLHALPLHHLHGLGISLFTSVLAGAHSRLLPKFDAHRIWDEMANATVWMAVPTMYQKLFETLDSASPKQAETWQKNAAQLRLATSGSAALPVRLAERWRLITGCIPLERFGMTEIGVGLTNPLERNERRPGWVGLPPPTVEIRIIHEDGSDVSIGQGELVVRGPSIFKGYWDRPDATESAFRDGWFLTGDRAERDEKGWVRLLGRTSVDILKSGGYKLSALEIEETLREHPAVREVAVIGLPDDTWGERVVAAIVPFVGRENELTIDAVRQWAKELIAPYKVPRQVVLLENLPKNALGKVVKPDLIRALSAQNPKV
ncbi:MAG: AMP-binding protein [Polyangiaceae bacterium]|nr:AMP-binding protein [Polyangiaceae bacterium]